MNAFILEEMRHHARAGDAQILQHGVARIDYRPADRLGLIPQRRRIPADRPGRVSPSGSANVWKTTSSYPRWNVLSAG